MTNGSALVLSYAFVATLGVLLLPPHQYVARLAFTKRRRLHLGGDRRIVSILCGALLGAVISIITRNASLLILLSTLGAVLGYIFGHHRDSRARVAHRRQTLEELPVIIEMLALAVSSGEAPATALQRISAHGSGPLMKALRGVASDMALGSTLVHSLAQIRAQLPYPEIDRFVDGMCIGHDRGTPLTEILHAQALDARERQRRSLIEAAAGTEVAMMIPVVFLIMPITIVFALFPSFYRMTWF